MEASEINETQGITRVSLTLGDVGAPTAPNLGLAWSRVGLALPALQREPKMAPSVKGSYSFLAFFG